jgi:DNA helicase-2/ATP-dependent DNA helicase PcrA
MKIDLSNIPSRPATRSTNFTPSPQQADIFRAIEQPGPSLIIEAVAGAGKTTTLIEGVARMKGRVAFTAFNKKIVTEIERKLGAIGVDTSFRGDVGVSTFHAFGLKALKGSGLTPRVDGEKVWNILEEGTGIHEKYNPVIARLVSLGKQYGVGVSEGDWVRPSLPAISYELIDHFDLLDDLGLSVEDTVVEEIVGAAYRVLAQSCEMANDIIDFDDMIYLPLLRDAYIPQSDWVLVDEAQDTNPTRRIMARRMLSPKGRLVAVGDPHQAIYGFTGANADSLDLIATDFQCVRLPLTITYRCPKKVVALARTWVSHITAADTAPEGEVVVIGDDKFYKMLASEVPTETAVLCRNTRPLVSAAYELIQRYIPCHVEGRDIGIGLLKLVDRWRGLPLKTMRDRLDDYASAEIARLESKNKRMKAAALTDKVETINVLLSMLDANATFRDFERQVLDLFGDTPEDRKGRGITLSTIHKAKGREWDTVYLYHRDKLMPSQYAKQDWELGQELNLCYVAVTRAKKKLVEVFEDPTFGAEPKDDLLSTG